MSLANIKFIYLDKIDNINSRISRYEEIIRDYSSRIKKAEKEEQPNISSVITAKEQYEHKINNMVAVREYYNEFVDTADYLLQNINSHDAVLANQKYEASEERIEELLKEIDGLQTTIFLCNNKIEKLEISEEMNKERVKKQRTEIKELKEKTKLLKLLEEENEFLKKKIKKQGGDNSNCKKIKREYYNERRKLTAENIMLKDTNDFLERKNQQLQDYCNHLLARRPEDF